MAGFQHHEAFLFGVAAVDDHGEGQFPRQIELGGKGLVLEFARAVVPVEIKADFSDGPEARFSRAGGPDGVEGLRGAALSVAGMDAEDEKDAGMGIKEMPPFLEGKRIKKDIADMGNARGGGPFNNGVAIRVEFLAVKMGVTVHAAGRQGTGKRINARRFLFGHVTDS